MEKTGLPFEGYFTYGADTMPGWIEAERRADRYSATRSSAWAARG